MMEGTVGTGWGRRLGRAVILVAIAAPAWAQTNASPGANAQRQVTFHKDIEPILQRSCQRCHNPNSVAPMSLLTYEQARPYAREIKRRTALARSEYGRGAMPPWFIEKTIGIQTFKDDVSLSDEEIATIAAWADAGAPEGNPADAPPALKIADPKEWALGKPDLIVSSPTIFVPAIGSDWQGAIGSVPTGLTESRYIASSEFKEVSLDFNVGKLPPGGTLGGRFVWHHAGVSIGDEFGVSADGEEAGEGVAGALPIHEVGRNGDVIPPEAGVLLPAHSTIVWNNNHIHAPGVPGAERSARMDLGFRFHPKGYKPTFNAVSGTFSTSEIDINANSDRQRVDSYWVAKENMKLVNYEPHMHAAGVRMCMEAIYGRVVETLNCAGYDHNWLRNYQYDDNSMPLLPKGTILHAISWLNNSASNANQIEPRNAATWGQSSVSNMVMIFSRVIYLTDEEFKAEVAKRQEHLLRTDGKDRVACPLCDMSKLRESRQIGAGTQ